MQKDDLDPLIPATGGQRIDAATKRGRLQMILLLLVCAAPVLASYFTFYVIKPQGGKTNIGQLVSPVQTMPLDGLDAQIQGKWTLLLARPASECKVGNDACVSLLYLMRQVRVAMGKESQRMQLIWLVTDGEVIDPELQKAYDKEVAGFTFIRMPKDQAQKEKLQQEIVAPYKQNWIGFMSVAVIILATIISQNPEIFESPLIPIPDL